MKKMNLNESSVFGLELPQKTVAQTESEKSLIWPFCPRQLYHFAYVLSSAESFAIYEA